MTGHQKKFLFVGGPADGQLRDMDLNVHGQPPYSWQVLLHDRSASRLQFFRAVDMHTASMFTTYEYTLEYVKDFDGEELGLYRGQDVKNVFELLMTNYKPEVAKRG